MVKMELFVSVARENGGTRLLWRGGERSRPAAARIAELQSPGPITGTQVDISAIQPLPATASHGSTAVAECSFEACTGIKVHRLIELIPPPVAPPLPVLLETLVRDREYDAALQLAKENLAEVERDAALWLLRVRAYAGARRRDEAAADAARLFLAGLEVPFPVAEKAWTAVRNSFHPWPEQLSRAVVRWWEAHPSAPATAFPRESVPTGLWPRAAVLAALDELIKAKSPDRLEEAAALLERLEELCGPGAEVSAYRQRVDRLRASAEELAVAAGTWRSELWPDGKVRPLTPPELQQGWDLREIPSAAFKEPNLDGLPIGEDARELLLRGALPRRGRSVAPGIGEWGFGPGKARGALADLGGGTRLLHLAEGGGSWDGALFRIGELKNEVGGHLCVDATGAVYLEIESTLTPLAASVASLATMLLARVAFGARAKQVYGKQVPKTASETFIELARAIDPEACRPGAIVDWLLDRLPR